jgi:hypothetical protein
MFATPRPRHGSALTAASRPEQSGIVIADHDDGASKTVGSISGIVGAYLTAAAINLKPQAVALLAPLVRWFGGTSRPTLGHCCATDAELATA